MNYQQEEHHEQGRHAGGADRERSHPYSIGNRGTGIEVPAVPRAYGVLRLTKMATASTGDEALDQMAHSVAVARLREL